METLKLVIIGIVQGITELLPVSSSAHILVLGKLLKLDIGSLLLITFHLGTTIAIFLFFWRKLIGNFTNKTSTFFLKIIVATIPAAIAGFLLDDLISEKLRAEWIIALSLIIWGVVMIVLERREVKNMEDKTKNLTEVSWSQALVIGLSQMLALIPGTSRSGITTITGILTGLKKYVALEFSFILSIPILTGTFIWMLLKDHSLKVLTDTVGTPLTINISIIVIVTFLVGFGTLHLLSKFRKSKWLTLFGIYRIILGLIILILFYL